MASAHRAAGILPVDVSYATSPPARAAEPLAMGAAAASMFRAARSAPDRTRLPGQRRARLAPAAGITAIAGRRLLSGRARVPGATSIVRARSAAFSGVQD